MLMLLLVISISLFLYELAEGLEKFYSEQPTDTRLGCSILNQILLKITKPSGLMYTAQDKVAAPKSASLDKTQSKNRKRYQTERKMLLHVSVIQISFLLYELADGVGMLSDTRQGCSISNCFSEKNIQRMELMYRTQKKVPVRNSAPLDKTKSKQTKHYQTE